MDAHPWILCQLAALFAAAWLFHRTTRGEEAVLRGPFLRALPFTVPGALCVDYALRIALFASSGMRGAPPRFGGIMAYGALLGCVLAYVVFVRRRRIGVAFALDRLAAPLALLVALGRIGCAIAGCEHGRPTRLPWAVRYSRAHPDYGRFVDAGVARPGDAETLGLHPATLYEALFALLACGVALLLLRRARTPGATFYAAVSIYASGRMVSESFRGDLARGESGPFTTGQAMSLFVLSLVLSVSLRAPVKVTAGSE